MPLFKTGLANRSHLFHNPNLKEVCMYYKKLLQSIAVSVLCTWILFSCSSKEPFGVQSAAGNGTGEALLYLPEIPGGFLGKSLALLNQPK